MVAHTIPVFDPCADTSANAPQRAGFIVWMKQALRRYVNSRAEQRVMEVMQSDPRMLRDWQVARDRQEWQQADRW